MIEFLARAWRPTVEIIVLFLLYYVILLSIRGTRAENVLMGLLVLVACYFVARLVGLGSLEWTLSRVFQFTVIGFIVIFHPELRQGLARLGRAPFLSSRQRQSPVVDTITEAAASLAAQRHGALIAVEREIGLGDYVGSGVPLDATLSAELLRNIFTPGSLLHDGGVIVSGGQLRCAAAMFPLTMRPVPPQMGSRHRAAIGLSEESDAFVIVVSEETGSISVATNGQLTHNVSRERLAEMLRTLTSKPKPAWRWPFRRHRP